MSDPRRMRQRTSDLRPLKVRSRPNETTAARAPLTQPIDYPTAEVARTADNKDHWPPSYAHRPTPATFDARPRRVAAGHPDAPRFGASLRRTVFTSFGPGRGSRSESLDRGKVGQSFVLAT